MSIIKEIISITPPDALTWESNRVEVLKSNIHLCPVCYGTKGKYYNEHDLKGERWEECSMCKGKGKIQADISVSWKPIELTPEQEQIDKQKRLLIGMLDCFTADTSNYSFTDFVKLTQQQDEVKIEVRKLIE